MSDAPGDGRLWTIEDATADRALRRVLAKHDAREREVTGRQLDAVRALAAGVAHDFSSLLTVIGGTAELMQEARTPAERETELAVVRQAAKRGQVLVGQLLSFAGQPPSLPARVPIDDALRALRVPVQALIHELIDAHCTLELALDADDATVVIDERQLSLALLSLVATAVTASTQDDARLAQMSRPLVLRSARCEPLVRSTEFRNADGEMITVQRVVAVSLAFPAPHSLSRAAMSDTGDLASTRDDAAISTTAALLAPMGGSVRRSANGDGGHTVTLFLPEAHHATPALQRTPAQGTALGRSASRLPILVVDDDAGPRRVIRRLLEREGYDVLTASAADDAMQQVEACDGALSAVVSDYLMPGMTGMELLARLRGRWPRLPVVLVSGFASEIVSESSMQQLRSHFLPKPFTREELIDALETASEVLRSA